ncbi:MAG: cytochrome c maturation protein CcmE [Chromatiales bacterium]|jgi:cytochrome c-type biogenesis protein CcmE
MTPARKKRFFLVGLMVAGVGVATTFALTAFNENMMFFFSPSEVAAGEVPVNQTFRLGGLVVPGTVNRPDEGLTIEFALTDNAEMVTVQYTGILPDLFREGQGIVSKGKLGSNGVFVADEVLAKHDENYMPPEVADAMKQVHAEGVGQ